MKQARCIGLASSIFAFMSGEVRAQSFGLDYQQAQTIPLEQMAERVLGQLGEQFVEARRPRPGQSDPLELATRPTPSYAGICQTQVLKVDFSRMANGPDSFIMGRSASLALEQRYRAIGDIIGSYNGWQASGVGPCGAQTDILLHYYAAPSPFYASLAARSLVAIVEDSLGRKPVARCGPSVCGGRDLALIAALSPGDIESVEADGCGEQLSTSRCLQITVYSGPNRPAVSRSPGIVQRAGFQINVRVRQALPADPHFVVLDFSEFTLEKVSVSSFNMTGPALFIP